MPHDFHLRYKTPADAWRDAFPLGNGRLRGDGLWTHRY